MKGLSKVNRIIEELRCLDPELPAHHALALIMIAADEGIPQIKVARALGISTSATQRVFAKLSDKGMSGRVGLRLIEIRRGRLDARETEAFLTPEGRQIIETLTSIADS